MTKYWLIFTTFWLTGCMDNYMPVDPSSDTTACVNKAQVFYARCNTLAVSLDADLDIPCKSYYDVDIKECGI